MVHLLIGNNRSVKHLVSQVAIDTNRRVICIDMYSIIIMLYIWFLVKYLLLPHTVYSEAISIAKCEYLVIERHAKKSEQASA